MSCDAKGDLCSVWCVWRWVPWWGPPVVCMSSGCGVVRGSYFQVSERAQVPFVIFATSQNWRLNNITSCCGPASFAIVVKLKISSFFVRFVFPLEKHGFFLSFIVRLLWVSSTPGKWLSLPITTLRLVLRCLVVLLRFSDSMQVLNQIHVFRAPKKVRPA